MKKAGMSVLTDSHINTLCEINIVFNNIRIILVSTATVPLESET